MTKTTDEQVAQPIKCPICGRQDVTLTRGGVLRVHADRRTMPAAGLRGGASDRCAGSGYPPVKE